MQIRPAALRAAPTWYDEGNPVISIIILNFNRSGLTIDCLRSLWANTQGHRYEIIVIDNGSRAEEYQILEAFEGAYQLVRMGVNLLFGEGNNVGVELAKGEFVALLNNDVIVTPNWLGPLIKAFEDKTCGVAGPKFIYPNGLLQEAGALLDEDGSSVQIGKFQDPNDPRFNRPREVDYVSAAAVVLRKSTFETVLGFDPIYEPAYYEDADLCLKIGKMGLSTRYIPSSCVVHHENATSADPAIGWDRDNTIVLNREKFVDRWQSYLKTGQHTIDTEAPSAPNLDAPVPGKPRAAFFATNNVLADEYGKAIVRNLATLSQAGYTVFLITPERISKYRIAALSDGFGIARCDVKIVELSEVEIIPAWSLSIFLAGTETTCRVNNEGLTILLSPGEILKLENLPTANTMNKFGTAY